MKDTLKLESADLKNAYHSFINSTAKEAGIFEGVRLLLEYINATHESQISSTKIVKQL